MLYKFLIDILQYSLPSITAIALFYLTFKKDNYSYKKAMEKERIEKCYFPFYRFYFTGMLAKIPFSKLTTKNQERFITLLTNNLYLLDVTSQALFSALYSAHIELILAQKSNSDLAIYEHTLDVAFWELKQSIFAEYKHLLKKLGLPVPKS